VIINELDKHADKQDCAELLKNAVQGKNLGLISEAGNPCIADPGADIVAFAHKQYIEVVPLVGPSSILLALIASGFNGQQFTFNGYLPIKEPERSNRIRQMENALRSGTTQIFMETPFRNQRLLEEVLKTCGDETLLCIACDLTLSTQFIKTQKVREWRTLNVDLNKRYCMFLLGK